MQEYEQAHASVNEGKLDTALLEANSLFVAPLAVLCERVKLSVHKVKLEAQMAIL